MQTTLKSPISFAGTGLHSGRPARVTVHPASAEYGIWFRRTDLDGPDALIPARWDAVVPSRLCTKLANGRAEVSTVEHLMAALAGCGVQNALIEIDGPEVPVMDGSAAPFVDGLLARGLRQLAAPVRVLRILEEVEVYDGDARVSLVPADGLEMEFLIQFPDRAIGVQYKKLNLANGTFVRELCDSRTFCRNAEVEAMRASGLAQGGTLENAVVFDGGAVLSPGGLRHEDEPVRHKMLDALGDLALAGAPILGRFTGVRAGHALTNRLLRSLFGRPGAFRLETCSPEQYAKLPGMGRTGADLKAVA